MTLLAPSQCALATAPSAAIRNRHKILVVKLVFQFEIVKVYCLVGLLCFKPNEMLTRCVIDRLLDGTSERSRITHLIDQPMLLTFIGSIWSSKERNEAADDFDGSLGAK
ncbi:hypothetical protein OUZ56_020647 [Daphnia magna]|uniref:Uncharacterized protein n=1 Tax=Daphnia magna TaxID=35525 RepID=A0ABQ9ZGJ2_9CRUS|nr:hypothetical protein OUZ56_020647 [Daphnia magna]